MDRSWWLRSDEAAKVWPAERCALNAVGQDVTLVVGFRLHRAPPGSWGQKTFSGRRFCYRIGQFPRTISEGRAEFRENNGVLLWYEFQSC